MGRPAMGAAVQDALGAPYITEPGLAEPGPLLGAGAGEAGHGLILHSLIVLVAAFNIVSTLVMVVD